MKRLLLPSLDEPTVKRELGNLHDNTRFKPLYDAFLGRQRADWLIGMSITRAYSVLGRQAGYGGVLSVGRVQTPEGVLDGVGSVRRSGPTGRALLG